MSGGGQLEPNDSRKVTGTKGDPTKSWHQQEDAEASHGEYEPADSRNVTGQSSQTADRWQNKQARPPLAAGDPPKKDGRAEAVEKQNER